MYRLEPLVGLRHGPQHVVGLTISLTFCVDQV